MKKRVIQATTIVAFLLYSMSCCKAVSLHLEFDQMLGVVAFSQDDDRLLHGVSFDVTTSNGVLMTSFDGITSAEMGFLMTVPVWGDYSIESKFGTCSVEYSMPVLAINEICERPAAFLVDGREQVNIPQGKCLLLRSLENNDTDIYVNGIKLVPGDSFAPIYDTVRLTSDKPTWLQMYYE